MRALVTGATGFVGGQLAAALCAAGHRVRALVRTTSSLARLDGLPVELVEGDLTDSASLERAVAGQQVVFHCAAAVGDWGQRARFFAVNAEGTRALLEACGRQGGTRLVYTSSLTVLGIPRRGERLDEQSAYTARLLTPYVGSKIAAEQEVRADWDRVPATIVRPGAIWGPGDQLFFGRWARLARRGWLFDIGAGRNQVAMTYIDNLVHGLVLAAEVPAAVGQIYHLTDGVDPTTGELFRLLARALGFAPPRLGVPVALLRGAAAGSELAARLLRRRRPPLLTRYAVELLACDGRYDISKARRELGYAPKVDLATGVANLAQWYKNNSSAR